jgi:hypothetical protein
MRYQNFVLRFYGTGRFVQEFAIALYRQIVRYGVNVFLPKMVKRR